MGILGRMIDVAQRQLIRRGLRVVRLPFPDDRPINLIEILASTLPVSGTDLTLVQIGANDGVSNDPVHELIVRHGWSALLIEPHPDAFKRLERVYAGMPNVRCVNCAIAGDNGTTKMYMVDGRDEAERIRVSQFLSFDRAVVLKQKRHVPNLENRIRPIDVEALTFTALLQRYHLDRIDILQTDTEGFDFEIVKMLLATPLRPSIISFEHTHLRFRTKQECARMLAAEGYRYSSLLRDTIAYKAPVSQRRAEESLTQTAAL